MTNLTQFKKTMSSLEIAELTGKRHDNVMNDIRKMISELQLDAPSFSGTQNYGNNNTREVFNLPKRETLILVSGYSVELRAKIIDRWEELESQVKPKTQIEIILAQAQALVDIERKQVEQDSRITELENRVQKRFTDDFENQFVTPTQIGAMFEPTKSAKVVNRLLKDYNLQWKVDGQWVPREQGKKYSTYDYIQLDNGKTVPQLLWKRKVKELLV